MKKYTDLLKAINKPKIWSSIEWDNDQFHNTNIIVLEFDIHKNIMELILDKLYQKKLLFCLFYTCAMDECRSVRPDSFAAVFRFSNPIYTEEQYHSIASALAEIIGVDCSWSLDGNQLPARNIISKNRHAIIIENMKLDLLHTQNLIHEKK